MQSPWYRVSVKATSFDDQGRFLLTKEDNGYWEFLGGGLEHGEDPQEAMARELHEEAGLEATWISEAPVYFITAARLDLQTMQPGEGYVANVIYQVKLKNLDFTPSDECVELRYFTVQEALKEDLFPNVKAFLKVYNPDNHKK